MSLQDDIYAKIKDELSKDPNNVGYASAKDDTAIMNLLNNPVSRSSTNYYSEQSPMSRILSGVALAPNIVSSTDVTNAKK